MVTLWFLSPLGFQNFADTALESLPNLCDISRHIPPKPCPMPAILHGREGSGMMALCFPVLRGRRALHARWILSGRKELRHSILCFGSESHTVMTTGEWPNLDKHTVPSCASLALLCFLRAWLRKNFSFTGDVFGTHGSHTINAKADLTNQHAISNWLGEGHRTTLSQSEKWDLILILLLALWGGRETPLLLYFKVRGQHTNLSLFTIIMLPWRTHPEGSRTQGWTEWNWVLHPSPWINPILKHHRCGSQ